MMETSAKGKAKRRHLNSEECREISRRPEGSQPLTQPHSVTRRHSNSNRGLYPRTPTKRKRDARDDKQQQGITKFFPVISVVKVFSPQKAALSQGPGSIKTEGLNGELIPKNETIEEEEEALATSMKEEPEDEKVDYLEGLTTDMFGDDKEFERCWSDPAPAFMNHHEEEVEALPDALYGLLGSSRGLAHPQGHVDDLPEEVLMLVLSLLPAEDLYCNVSLVCQRWRNIVTQSLFVPWKKLYYRYTKKEIDAVKEINAILETHRIIKDDQESILHIVEFMAQYKPSQKVKPEAVLQSVRTHCLFLQAEACIKHRLPKLEGIEGGPNPWAAMALMLVLCDGVGDVLDLVVCLRGCLPSASAITEYLSAMATMLLAMRRNDINISNRWHYNIFYVLHLMENALPTAITNQSGRAQVQVTHEQQQILNHDIHRDHVVKIMAFAGTGKTTTLIRYAQQRPHLHFLYMAFNKSVATQAQRCFPSNVDCRTVHSMAFGAVGKRYQELKKLSSNVKPFSVAWVLPKGSGGFVNAKVVTLTLNTYMASVDTHITPNHVPNTYKNTHGKVTVPDRNAKRMFARDAQRIWDKMVALEETREYAHHMTHDGYLKLWQLQRPTLDKYDVIFIDEAQDCTPAIMDIMLPQHCGKILVGDPHQQIYTFRGAVNALNLVEHTHLYYLTQSFRFGSEIAYIGATILQVCKKVKKILVGGKQDGCVQGKAVDSLRPLTTGSSPGRGKLAVLSRSNVSVFDQAVRLTDANPRCRLHIVGGVENFGLKRIMDIWVLMQPENNRSRGIKDSFIRRFTQQSLGGYFGLKSYAKKTEDRELEGKLSMVEKYNSRIPELVERLYGCTERDAQHADFILGTVHKSKGLEFDTVVITDDFAKVPCAAHNLPRLSSCSGGDIPDDEWNLLYVAVTRAKSSLVITKNITNILTLAGEYFLRTELTSALLTEGQPPCCSVRECHNHIMPDWPLAMCKLPLQYSQRMKQGTVLAPVIDLKRGGSADDRQIIDTPPHIAAGLKDTAPSGFSSGDALIPLADEYDPMFPNDYEKVVKRHREERQRQREQERLKEIEDREKKRKDRHEGSSAPSGFSRFPAAEGESDEEEEEDYEKEKRKRSMGGAAIAPPSSLVDSRDSSSYSYDDEMRPSRGSKAAIPPPMYEDSDRPRSPPGGPTNSFLANMGGTVAHKIMQKYGFREGQGLGKHEQGLSTALSVEKTSKRGGKIIIGDNTEKMDPSKKSEANPLTEILKCPTKVVLLRNMVGRGEVDEDLEGETKEECEKYGKVIKCVIFEIAQVTDDEAVRIFLEFERVESAIKAVVDLNGRFFGGRVVKACFYNQDKFRVLDLGEQM